MQGTINFILSVTPKEIDVIRDFLETTRKCPIDLSGDDIFTLLEDISNRCTDPDIDGITIEYNDPDEDNKEVITAFEREMLKIGTR